MAAKSAVSDKQTDVTDHCFFSGYKEVVRTTAVTKNGTKSLTEVSVRGPKKPKDNQFDICAESLKPLLQKQLNSFCLTVYDGDCSMDGFYQPKLPDGRNGHFVASAMYKYPWYFLKMPETSTIQEFKNRAQGLCAMTYEEVVQYSASLKTQVKKDGIVQYYCFLSSYITVLLERKCHDCATCVWLCVVCLYMTSCMLDGYGFSENQTFTVVDSVDGHKVSSWGCAFVNLMD